MARKKRVDGKAQTFPDIKIAQGVAPAQVFASSSAQE